MLVLRTSNFQMATIRSIVPRHNTLLSLFLTTKFSFAADSVSPRMNTIASCDQIKPIRIGENFVVNYNGQ